MTGLRLYLHLFSFLVLGSCSRPAPPPGGEAQAVAAVCDRILKIPALFGRVEYNPADPALIEPHVREGIRLRFFGRFATGEADERRQAETLAGNVWGRVLATPEGRAAFEQRVRAYWENPPVTAAEGGVAVDLGVCPGPVEQTSKGTYTIGRSEFLDRGELRADELVRRLERLRAQAPRARFYRVEASGEMSRRSPVRLRYEYWPERDELVVSFLDGRVFVSPAPVGRDLTRLADGRAPVRTEDLDPLESGRGPNVR